MGVQLAVAFEVPTSTPPPPKPSAKAVAEPWTRPMMSAVLPTIIGPLPDTKDRTVGSAMADASDPDTLTAPPLEALAKASTVVLPLAKTMRSPPAVSESMFWRMASVFPLESVFTELTYTDTPPKVEPSFFALAKLLEREETLMSPPRALRDAPVSTRVFTSADAVATGFTISTLTPARPSTFMEEKAPFSVLSALMILLPDLS